MSRFLGYSALFVLLLLFSHFVMRAPWTSPPESFVGRIEGTALYILGKDGKESEPILNGDEK